MEDLVQMAANLPEGTRAWIPKDTNFAVATATAHGCNGEIKDDDSPIPLFKSIKNPAEQLGMKMSHISDGVALAYFFTWLSVSKACTSLTRMTIDAEIATR